jgi:preprotein translocase subunit SecY
LFTLNIFPAINATIILQFLIGFSPQLAKLQKEGDFQGRREISRLTRNITLILAIVQSIGVTLYLRPILFDWNVGLASQIVLWLTAGAMIVLWLSEVITDYGLGNGTSLLVYTNIVSNLPNLINKIVTENSENPMVLSVMSTFGLVTLVLVALYAIVLLQNSTLNINLISSKRLSRVSSYDGREDDRISYLPLRFNQAGVMPIILTTSILVLPNYLINLGIFQSLNFLINFKWIYWPVYFVLILAFSSFYSSIVLNPKDISDQLQKSAVKIPGVRPGVQTIYYLKQEIQRITLMGATLLAFITIVPNFIESTLNITSLNGLSTTSFLILGGVVLDLKREVSNIYFSEIYTDMYR